MKSTGGGWSDFLCHKKSVFEGWRRGVVVRSCQIIKVNAKRMRWLRFLEFDKVVQNVKHFAKIL